MTPSELDEIWCVCSQVVICVPKEFHPHCLDGFPEMAHYIFYFFAIFAVPMTIQNVITWAVFIVLKNKLHHFQAQRIGFHLVYLTA